MACDDSACNDSQSSHKEPLVLQKPMDCQASRAKTRDLIKCLSSNGSLATAWPITDKIETPHQQPQDIITDLQHQTYTCTSSISFPQIQDASTFQGNTTESFTNNGVASEPKRQTPYITATDCVFTDSSVLPTSTMPYSTSDPTSTPTITFEFKSTATTTSTPSRARLQ
ncbi:hypothetical protein Salat_1457000 [Sesamum alatum]|uniref:Uncharacterized protein n=1 Tax=Sesamum alatum TaxID=300844 RepID=A0AAE1YBE5_9LAMI|nr:hypothetical protein Salat_1457000 [Sesamum alatum]